MDDLFVRHTYLGAVIGMVVQASFGIDIRRLAEADPADLLQGRELYRATGLHGALESDFFAWPVEVGGNPLLQTLARRVARFQWADAPPDTAAVLYETVIPPEERRQLGEYYTPAWLARVMVRELVDDPLRQRVLDPACGSGTFIAEAVAHFLEAAGDRQKQDFRDYGIGGIGDADNLDPSNPEYPNNPVNPASDSSGRLDPIEVLNRLRGAVTGIDVHPVAVHLARAARTLAARPAINAAHAAGFDASLSIPVYLGDALQLRFRTGDMFAESQIAIQTRDDDNTELVFPVSLVERAENFDALMGDVSAYIEAGEDPLLALDDNHINDPAGAGDDRGDYQDDAASPRRGARSHLGLLHAQHGAAGGPVAGEGGRGDRQPAVDQLQPDGGRTAGRVAKPEPEPLRHLGGRALRHPPGRGRPVLRPQRGPVPEGWRRHRVRAASQRVAGGAALQVAERRLAGRPQGAGHQRGLHPQAGVGPGAAGAQHLLPGAGRGGVRPQAPIRRRRPAPGRRGGRQWRGRAGSDDVARAPSGITDTGVVGDSPYVNWSRQGAIIAPRCLFFVNETENTAVVQAAQTVTVNPRRGSQDKAPWKDLDLTDITSQTVERKHFFSVHLGETVAAIRYPGTIKGTSALQTWRYCNTN